MVATRQLRQFRVSAFPEIEWDGTGRFATMRLLEEDGTPIHITMPARTLQRMKADIERAFDIQPPANPLP
jgi:hypothetical protein